MDQSFSPDNLRRVWDGETRRGKDLLGWFPEVHAAFETWRARRTQMHGTRAPVAHIAHHYAESTAEIDLANLKENAEALLAEALAVTSDRLVERVESGSFHWSLHELPIREARHYFGTSGSVMTYFADKQLQRNVDNLLKAPPSSRHEVVAGLAGTIRNDLPKVVVRADIIGFYENVDHGILLESLQQTNLSPTSLGLIRSLLGEYEVLTGAPVGLPTGVGLSAKLAEFYLADLDISLRGEPDVIFYGRYVDDIIMVVGQRKQGIVQQATVLALIDSALGHIKLASNTSKCQVRELSEQCTLSEFEFLGYAIKYGGGRLDIGLTTNRLARIKKRLRLALDAWDKSDPMNHGRRRLLFDRLRFLAGNTRLSHNKRNAMVGIYFSNEMISDSKSLRGLDAYLKAQLAKSIFPADMERKINEISFVRAFDERAIRRFTPNRLKQITGAWHV